MEEVGDDLGGDSKNVLRFMQRCLPPPCSASQSWRVEGGES